MASDELPKAKIRSYRDLIVWQKAMSLVVEVYDATRGFPKDEIYGLTSQLRRAAVSVPSNIAEGQGRYGHRELLQFLGHSRGSLAELGTQVTLAARLGLLPQEREIRLNEHIAEVGRLLSGLRRSLTASDQTERPRPKRPPH